MSDETFRRMASQTTRELTTALADAHATIARLEAALRSIADNTCCEGCQEAARVARAALSPREGEG
jgi:hypothetical protein